MNNDLFNLLPTRNISFVYNYIQNVVPFVYDESLELYSLLNKLINYCNELGERNNKLLETTQSLVEFLNENLEEIRTFINNYTTQLNKEWEEFKPKVDEQYESFVNTINLLMEDYKGQVETRFNNNLTTIRTDNQQKYNDLESTLNNQVSRLNTEVNNIQSAIDTDIETFKTHIEDLVSDYQRQFTEYQTTINNNLTNYQDLNTQALTALETKITGLINEIPQKIQEATETTNMVPAVNEALNNYDMTSIFQNLYGSLITIYSMSTEPLSRVESDKPVYNYNPDTGVLTNLVNLEKVPIQGNSIYIFEGHLYIAEIGAKNVTSLRVTGFIRKGQSIDGTKIVYGNETQALYYLDLTTNHIATFTYPVTTSSISNNNGFGDCCVIDNNVTRIKCLVDGQLEIRNLTNNNVIAKSSYGSGERIFTICVLNGLCCYMQQYASNMMQRTVSIDSDYITWSSQQSIIIPTVINSETMISNVFTGNDVYDYLYIFYGYGGVYILAGSDRNSIKSIMSLTKSTTYKKKLSIDQVYCKGSNLAFIFQDTTNKLWCSNLSVPVAYYLNYTLGNKYFVTDSNKMYLLDGTNKTIEELDINFDSRAVNITNTYGVSSLPTDISYTPIYNNEFFVMSASEQSIDVIGIGVYLGEIAYQRSGN